MGNAKANLINEKHPSYGVSHAWFMFCFRTDDGPGRLLLVEAKNAWAVQTIERVAIDGRVNPRCELLTVHQECYISLRSDMVDEVPYVDFMIDVVEPGRLIQDALVAHAFRTSLTPEEARHAVDKMKSVPARVDPPAPTPSAPAGPSNYEGALAALTDLGFKSAQAKKALDGLDASQPIEALIKTALQRSQVV